MIGAVLLVLSKKLVISKPFVLIMKYTKLEQKNMDPILKKHCNKFEVRNTTMDDSGNGEVTVEVTIKEKHSDLLINELKDIKGVKKVMIFSHTGELSE